VPKKLDDQSRLPMCQVMRHAEWGRVGRDWMHGQLETKKASPIGSRDKADSRTERGHENRCGAANKKKKTVPRRQRMVPREKRALSGELIGNWPRAPQNGNGGMKIAL